MIVHLPPKYVKPMLTLINIKQLFSLKIDNFRLLLFGTAP